MCYFLHDYLGHPVPSPALLKPRHDRFIASVKEFADHRDIPFVSFERVDSKDAFVAPYRARFTAREGVVLIGVAPEQMRSFKAHNGPAMVTHRSSISRASRSRSITTTSTSTISAVQISRGHHGTRRVSREKR